VFSHQQNAGALLRTRTVPFHLSPPNQLTMKGDLFLGAFQTDVL